MRRWTVRVLVCLVLGAVVNVAVAWGCACMAHRISYGSFGRQAPFMQYEHTSWGRGDVESLRESDRLWIEAQSFEASETYGDMTDWIVEDQECLGFRQTSFRRVSAGFNGVQGSSMDDGHRSQSGWPCLAFQSDRSWPSLDNKWTGGRQKNNAAIEVGESFTLGPLGDFAPVDLPLRPIWPGFLLNTLFYTVVWFVLLFGPGTTRRTIRRTRGRCPSCGYDLQGALAAGCPECGWGRETGAES